MLLLYNYYSSFISILYNSLISVFSAYYLAPLLISLVLFVRYRIPYCYTPYLFVTFLITVVFSLFISLFFARLFSKLTEFFSGFIPMGTPLYICSFVCIAETISFIIRPVVLIIRPFINISLGCFGAVALGGLCVGRGLWSIALAFLFFYEVFVALVHWFIVTSILSFSIEH